MKKQKTNAEIRITGYGGQGVIMMGYIIGKATSIFDNRFSILNQSFGPEARGSACSAQVLVNKDRILYPYLRNNDIMIAMSQEGFDTHYPALKDNGFLVYENDLVKPAKIKKSTKAFSIPSTRLAEEMGRKLVQNVVMLGFFTATTGLVEYEAMKKAVETSVPPGTEELNLSAFQKGYDYFNGKNA